MDIISKDLSPESHVKVSFVGGKVVLAGSLDTKGAVVGLNVAVDSDYFLDELAAKIPGVIDDAIIAVLKQALKAL